ncbi:MAG TPA: hypothetical protein VMM58_06720 [Bacteroidota bacterium]|nr:hypothetical protein [Bacteroidota bacterium]
MKILLAYVRLHSVRTAGLVYFLIAGALTQVPLFNYLGYEFSAALTIPAAVISGLLAISFVRVHVHQTISRRKFLFVLAHYFIVNALLLLIPLVVITANALVVKNCSLSRGFAFYILLPVCTMIFSVSLGAVIGVLFRRARMIFMLVLILILAQIPYVTYTEPQLFAYNFILGYFPGITYDETLNGLSSLLLYREFTIVASIFLVTIFFLSVKMVWSDYKFAENVEAFRMRKGDGALYASAVVCLIVLVYGHFQRAALGFEFSASDIQTALGGMATTSHFTLFYPKEKVPANEVRLLKAEAEFQYAVDNERMEEPLPPDEKITAYLYPNSETKQKYIGTATTNIAKPWRREIHLTLDSFEDTFRHELVHVLAAPLGLPIIGASDRLALNEGFAMAVDWNLGNYSPHEYAAAMQRDHLLGDPEALFSYTGFAAQQGSYAYIVAGSFSRYLIDRFGMDSFKEVFPAAHFMAVYGRSLASLIEDWEGFLKTVDVSSLPPETVKTLFAQQSIFRKTCARVTAERNAEAVRAIRVKDFAAAETQFSASYDDAHTAFALRGLFQSLLDQKKFNDVLQMYGSLDERSMLRYNPGVLLLLGDAFWMDGDVPRALSAYLRVEEMNYNQAFSESAALRRLIVREPRLNDGLLEYFYGNAGDSNRTAIVKNLSRFDDSRVVANYLLADELFSDKKYEEAGTMFNSVSGRFSDPVLSLSSSLNSGRAFYKAGDFGKAKGAFWSAQNFTRSSTVLKKISEWIDRCDFVSAEMQ